MPTVVTLTIEKFIDTRNAIYFFLLRKTLFFAFLLSFYRQRSRNSEESP